MTITDSVKEVFKHRSLPLMKELFTVDVKLVFTDLFQEALLLFQSAKKVKFKPAEIKESLVDGYEIIKILPGRIHQGLQFFRDDFLQELERKKEQSEKTEFCLKVFGALTSYTLEILVSIKSGKPDLELKGFRTNAFTRFLAMELVLRMTRLFLRRLLWEIETNLSEMEDREKIKYFHDLLSGDQTIHDLPTDPAINVVQKLRFYILTGVREV